MEATDIFGHAFSSLWYQLALVFGNSFPVNGTEFDQLRQRLTEPPVDKRSPMPDAIPMATKV